MCSDGAPTRQFLRLPAETDAATCGPKAAVLARAIAAGLPVPPFVVIAASAYGEHLARTGVPTGDPAAVRSAILGTPLAANLLAELRAAPRELGAYVAVRSSGTAEDLPGFSFAGQYSTVLDVISPDLEAAVLECWASLWGERAVAYRERNGIPHDAAAMAVIVQRFVRAECGGVAFTADPVTGAHTVVVESSEGGAEAIVSGHVDPERSVFEREELASDTVGDAPAAGASGSSAPGSIPRAVARLALAAEDLLGCPADIEWAWAEDELWLLQARPITAGVSASARAPGEDYAAGSPASTPTPRYRATAWSNVNTGEVLPHVVTPMTWSIVGHLATGLIDSLFGKLGIRVDNSRLTTLIAGRAYFNASLLGSAFEKIPARGDQDITSIFGGMDAPPGFTDLPIAPEDAAHVSTVRLVLGVPLVLVYFARHSPKMAARRGAEMRAEADRALASIAAAADEDALAAATDRVVHALDSMVDTIAFSGVAMAFHGQFVGMAKRHFGEDGPALANELLAGQGGVASADAGLALARLGAQGREHPAVAGALRSSEQWASVCTELEALGPEGRSFLSAWERFLAEHGHHARGELEFGSPRWAECPDDVLAMVTGLLDVVGSDDLLAAHEARGRRAAEAEAEALAAVGPLARVRFRWLLRRARDGARTRENAKNDGVRVLAAGRQALLALGRSMATRGVFSSADDILFLTWDEVPAARTGGLDVRQLVATRRAEYEVNCAITPPSVVIGEWDGRPAEAPVYAPYAPDELTGLGVAAGVARGRARVIRSLESSERVLPGEVLVAPFTDPGWTPYFIPAAAIVVDMGGMLSHGSIIAREYGIPGVVNVGLGTALIRTGDLVEVDGSHGVVRVLERCEMAET